MRAKSSYKILISSKYDSYSHNYQSRISPKFYDKYHPKFTQQIAKIKPISSHIYFEMSNINFILNKFSSHSILN